MKSTDENGRGLRFSAREMGPDCPSELALERHRLGLTPPADIDALGAHITGCFHCRRWMKIAEEGVEALPDFDAAATLAAVRTSALPPRWRRQWPVIGVALVAAAAAVLLAVRPPGAGGIGGTPRLEDEEQPAIRVKGGVALYAWREAPDGGAERLISGATVAPGDRIRFGVDLKAPSELRIIGVEANGATYTAWPLDPALPTQRPAGKGQALPGAAVFDDSTGTERFYVVACPPDGPSPECRAGETAADAPDCPDACAVSPFVVEKAGR